VPAAGAMPAAGTAPGAATASSWKVMHSRNARLRQDQLAGVSCATARACVAVGNSTQ
jgi:hypothetical protein